MPKTVVAKFLDGSFTQIRVGVRWWNSGDDEIQLTKSGQWFRKGTNPPYVETTPFAAAHVLFRTGHANPLPAELLPTPNRAAAMKRLEHCRPVYELRTFDGSKQTVTRMVCLYWEVLHDRKTYEAMLAESKRETEERNAMERRRGSNTVHIGFSVADSRRG